MTEVEWLSYTDPDPWRRVTHPMLTFLESIDKVSERKFRLFAVACCRLLCRKLQVPSRYERLVDVAECYADGAASFDELQVDWSDPDSAIELETWKCPSSAAHYACMNTIETGSVVIMAECASGNAAWAASQPGAVMQDDNGVSEARLVAEQATQCDIIRCIFGNPFRPIILAAPSRTHTVTSLARAAYDERQLPSGEIDPQRLAVLADALEEAGCTDEAILAHCRGTGPHVRGCFAVDLCLGLS